MAAYATFADVQARAGRLAGVFSIAGKHPDQTDVTQILADVAAELDAAISAAGFTPAALSQGAKDALRDLNAAAAVARALPAADQSKEALAIADRAARTWQDALVAIKNRSLAALAELEAGEGGTVGPSAGSFWEDEPSYGGLASVLAEIETLRDTNLAPTFSRGQKL